MQSNLFVLEKNYKALRDQNINVRLNYTLEFTQSQRAYELMINKGDYSEIKTIRINSIIEAFTYLIKAKNADTPYLYCQLNIDIKVNNLTVFEDCVNMDDIPYTKEDKKNHSIIENQDKQIEYYNNFIKSDTRLEKIYNDYRKNNLPDFID